MRRGTAGAMGPLTALASSSMPSFSSTARTAASRGCSPGRTCAQTVSQQSGHSSSMGERRYSSSCPCGGAGQVGGWVGEGAGAEGGRGVRALASCTQGQHLWVDDPRVGVAVQQAPGVHDVAGHRAWREGAQQPGGRERGPPASGPGAVRRRGATRAAAAARKPTNGLGVAGLVVHLQLLAADGCERRREVLLDAVLAQVVGAVALVPAPLAAAVGVVQNCVLLLSMSHRGRGGGGGERAEPRASQEAALEAAGL
jgi:hypothetical protein